ncbi:MAG TPA: RluA family pseudouridine synthase [Gemmatales bacterium]|nr:RluA family pseudouridine synthase [Gemmatales bacterium]HMP58347.1 RluA family pseudouridine synthase [Gemmatales bacterium]
MDLPPLAILYEDNHCVAIWKPPGALTTGYEGGEETLDRQVKAYLKDKHGKPGNVFLGVVHRLDRPVSGVLLFARNSKAAGRLAELFRTAKVRKLYWGVVPGTVQPATGRLEDWLWKDRLSGIVSVTVPHAPEARHALLHYQTLGVADELTWLGLYPQTGRTHQLRVQLASRGHPLLGDTKYRSTLVFPTGIALHARSLTFLHPIRYEPITVTAEVPESWQSLAATGWDFKQAEAKRAGES